MKLIIGHSAPPSVGVGFNFQNGQTVGEQKIESERASIEKKFHEGFTIHEPEIEKHVVGLQEVQVTSIFLKNNLHCKVFRPYHD